MNKKRIYVFVSNDIQQDQRLHRIAQSLEENGFDTTVVGRYKNNKKKLSLPFKTHRFSLLINKGPAFYIVLNIRILIYLLFKKCDFIYSVDEDTLLACTLLSKMKNKPLIFDAHELFYATPEVQHRKLVASIWKTIGKLGSQQAALRFTVNESIAEVLEQEYKKPFIPIQNAPELSHQHYDRTLTKPYTIYYQGMINEGRGIEALIMAFRSELLHDYNVVIAGSGDIEQKVLRLIQTHKLENRISYKGMLNKTEMDVELQKATIGVNLLDGASKSYRLSLANKFFDYVHAELPSIHMHFPEYAKHINQYKVGEMISDLNTETIVNTILMMTKSTQYEHYVSECQKAKRIWNWEQEQRKLINAISRL